MWPIMLNVILWSILHQLINVNYLHDEHRLLNNEARLQV